MFKKTLTAIITATALFGLNANVFAFIDSDDISFKGLFNLGIPSDMPKFKMSEEQEMDLISLRPDKCDDYPFCLLNLPQHY